MKRRPWLAESIKTIIAIIIGAYCGMRFSTIYIRRLEKLLDKYIALYRLFNAWMENKQAGNSISEYFEVRDYHNIVIYGMARTGVDLVRELKDTSICIKYKVDKNPGCANRDSDVTVLNKENFKDVDIVIVTALSDSDEIVKFIKSKVPCNVVTIEDVIYSLC